MIDLKSEILNAVIYTVIYFALFITGELIYRRFPSSAEISRKFVHLTGGLIALSLPYFIRSHWTVLVLAVTFALAFQLAKKIGVMKAIYGIERVSYGEICYPLAIYLIFLLSSDKPVIYFVSILVMAVSDTLAALVGGKYGIIKFEVEGNIKSLEGSVVFFFVTFLCIHLPLLLMTDIGRMESVLIAFIIALLVTGFEAISLSGSDNIFVPFGTYYILAKMTHHSLPVIVWQTEILLMIIAAAAFMYEHPKILKASGLIGMVLINYASLSLCNFLWFLPLLLAQVMFYILINIFVCHEGKEKLASFQIKVLFYTGLIPILLIFAANTAKDPKVIYIPYISALISQIAIISAFFFSRSGWVPRLFRGNKIAMSLFCTAVSVLFVGTLPVLLYGNILGANAIAIAAISVWVAYLANVLITKYYRGKIDELLEHRIRLVSTSVAVICAFIIQGIVNI